MRGSKFQLSGSAELKRTQIKQQQQQQQATTSSKYIRSRLANDGFEMTATLRRFKALIVGRQCRRDQQVGGVEALREFALMPTLE